MRDPMPQDYKFTVECLYPPEEDLISPEEAGRPIRQQQQGRSLRDYVSYFISSIWYTIVWTVTLGGNLANTGYEQLDFGCGAAVQNDDRLLASLEIDPNQEFFKLCTLSRRQKKPILVVLVSNPDDESQVDLAIQSLVENSQLTQDLIKQRFNLFVVSQEQLDQYLLKN